MINDVLMVEVFLGMNGSQKHFWDMKVYATPGTAKYALFSLKELEVTQKFILMKSWFLHCTFYLSTRFRCHFLLIHQPFLGICLQQLIMRKETKGNDTVISFFNTNLSLFPSCQCNDIKGIHHNIHLSI